MMSKLVTFIKQYRIAIFSGVLVGTSYIPFPPWAVLFCYVPLWCFALQKASNWKEAFWAGWSTQFVLSLIGFHWIAYVSHEFGRIPWPFAILLLLLFCAFIHLYIPLVTTLGFFLKKHLGERSSFFAMALIHSLIESIWPSLFPWHLGYTTLWIGWPLFQIADTIGFLGISCLFLLINAWIACTWKKNFKKHAFAIASLLILLTGVGYFKQIHWSRFDQKFDILVTQANIGNMEKIYAEKGAGFQQEITQKFISLTQMELDKLQNVDLILWPETAFPDYLDIRYLSEENQKLLSENVKKWNRPLLTGAYSKDPPKEDGTKGDTYNGIFLLSTEGLPLNLPYRKTHLLAFGEYIPFSETFPILEKWITFMSNFGRGKGPFNLNWPHHQGSWLIGAQVCYEGLFPYFSREQTLQGAHLLANVTNDSWFGYPFEPRQHLYMTFARAIENRRPLVRSTNTGISSAILANGKILSQSPLHSEWTGVFPVQFASNPPFSFYTLYGQWIWWLVLIALVCLILINMKQRNTYK